MKFIELLREGEHTSDIYLCKVKQVAKTKAGKNYYSLILQDKTGTIDGKVWDLSSGIDHFEAMDYIRIEGDVTCYQGALQLNIKRIRVARPGEYEPKDFLPVSQYPIDGMYRELLGYIDRLGNEHLKGLARRFFVEDQSFVQAFQSHSAAKSVHHGFVGGLLEHTIGVAKLCEFYTVRYPILNKDLLIAAALFHDIGKVRELSAFPANDYTNAGQLLGHIVIGVEMLDEKIRDIPDFPPMLALELKHCILAHHGEYEYGSPKLPAIIEAMALNFADNTDAKLETMKEYLEGNHADGEWLGYNRLFESNIKRTSK